MWFVLKFESETMAGLLVYSLVNLFVGCSAVASFAESTLSGKMLQ